MMRGLDQITSKASSLICSPLSRWSDPSGKGKVIWDKYQEELEEQAGSHRAGHSALLLRPVPEPDDGGSRLGIEGSAREVVGGACL